MREKWFFILLSLFALICYCNGQSEKLSIHIQSSGSEFILGEPAQFILIWENTSGAPIRIAKGVRLRHSLLKLVLEGPVKKECEGIVTLAEEKVGFNSIINPHEIITIPIVLRDIGAVNAGEYAIRAEFDSTKLESWWDKFNVDRISVVSNIVVFRLVKPTGVDMEVFSKYSDKCNRIMLSPSELLQRYPTSTYAGYELCKGGPSLRRAAEIDDAKRDMDWSVPQGASQEDQQKRRDAMRQGYEEYVTRVRDFLKVHPDFVKADVLRNNLAVFLLYLDKRSEAIEQLEILSKMEGKNAEEAREVLGCMEGKKKMDTAPVEKSVPEAVVVK